MAQNSSSDIKAKALGDLEAKKLPSALKKARLGAKKFPKDSDFHAIAGFVLTEMGKHKESIPYFIEASKGKPDDPQFAENLANALMQTHQVGRALAYAQQKLRQFPRNKELQRVIDEIELKTSNSREIIEHANKRLEKGPDNANLRLIRSRAYAAIGFAEQSAQDVLRAYELDPDDDHIALDLASYLHQSGKKAEALDVLSKLPLESDLREQLLYLLSSMVGADQVEDLLDKIEAVPKHEIECPYRLEFAKANLLQKRDGLAASMAQFEIANASHHATNPYSASDMEKRFARICGIFPFNGVLPVRDPDDELLPIFVVGQPRSGTTLMEMMLSSVPGITGCGELIIGQELAQPIVDAQGDLDDAAVAHFAQSFRDLMPPLPADAFAFVDKMPNDYEIVGFLLAAFPNARIINMLRDPRDVGLSTWIRMFPASGLNYASKQSSIAHSANLYRKYMAHWDNLFGDRILTVRYENLVSEPEKYSRIVADYCGFEWDASMLHPEKNKKMVQTASIDQVRDKISTKSIGGWRGVSGHLGPMIEGLDPDLWPEYSFD